MDMSIAAPKGYEPSSDHVKKARASAGSTGARIILTHDPVEAVKGANVLYTDTWVSMGQEKETARRLKAFKGYQIDGKLAAKADKDYIFMHCLPAHRGQEISKEVIDGSHSVIFDEAENRLHIQKAIMVFLYNSKK
jgi:ornithine carbamoyltransferase